MIMDISRMQEKAPGHFHKGFYLTENIIKQFLGNRKRIHRRDVVRGF